MVKLARVLTFTALTAKLADTTHTVGDVDLRDTFTAGVIRGICTSSAIAPHAAL